MVFSSLVFLLGFLPALLLVYFLIPARFRGLRNLVLLGASLFFYWWGAGNLVLLMVLSIAVNYLGGLLAGQESRRTARFGVLFASVAGLGLLGWFKYAGFLAQTIHDLGFAIPIPQVTLPIGISFFTFQGLSYVIDVYRGDTPPNRSIAQVALYISFFPQLIAGPIVRYTDVAEDMNARRESLDDAAEGAVRFIFGLGKKCVLSNALAELADSAFACPEGELSTALAWLGIIACLVPVIILPYYCTIGGWVLKYLATYLTGGAEAAMADGYFTGFITSTWSPILWFLIFPGATMLIVYKGVDTGIERFSKVLMPILLVLILAIAVFSLTLTHTDAAGNTRTGLQGFLVYVVPNFSGMTIKTFLMILMDAMGQLFYSISVAMGIMVTYGSYVKKETNLVKSVNQIEIFDTVVAFLAGLMIVPAVFTFMGTEGMNSGPSLMFVSLPKVFGAMGAVGVVVGAAFFLMVAFAALTSSVSIMEAIVSSMMDKFRTTRKKAILGVTAVAMVAGIVVCLGYNLFYFELMLPNSTTPGQILDVLDYISNYILMPIVAISTCILIG